MKLFYKKGACSLAVRIILNEIGVDFSSESVDLATKKTESGSDFLKINSKGAVPTLMLDDGKVLTENLVIQQYLADRFLATQLLPHDFNQFERYHILEWMNYISTDLHQACCSPLFNPKLPDEVKQNVFKPALERKLHYLEAHLHGKDSLVMHFSLADAYLFVILSWLPRLGLELSSSWPHLSKYYQSLQSRPSVKKSLQEEKLI